MHIQIFKNLQFTKAMKMISFMLRIKKKIMAQAKYIQA